MLKKNEMSVGLKDAVDRMKPLFTDKCPFVNPPNIKEKIQWVRPKLGCEIEYAELTADEQLPRQHFSVGEMTKGQKTLCWRCINQLMGEKTLSPSSTLVRGNPRLSPVTECL